MNVTNLVISTLLYFFRVDNICYNPDTKYFASCINIDFCNTIQDVLKNASAPSSTATQTLLNYYKCGGENSITKVWCPLSVNMLELLNPHSHKNMNKESPNVDSQKNKKRLPGKVDYYGTELKSLDNNIRYNPHTRYFTRCININFCRPIQDILKNATKLLNTTRNLLQFYECGDENGIMKVWCPLSANITEPPNNNSDENMNIESSHLDSHRNRKLLPTKCGLIDIAAKILNGKGTAVREYPWIVLIAHNKTGGGTEFVCGGTIINSRYILTAAHCINDNLSSVRIGEHNLETPIDCELDNQENCYEYQDLPIQEATAHPMFDNPDLFSNDIGLIRVPEINFSKTFTLPICLPWRNFGFSKNRPPIIAGWGTTQEKNYSSKLLQTTVSILDFKTCQEKAGTVELTEHRQICSANNRSGTCEGDSGGPLQVRIKYSSESRFVQQGIVSFGSTRCNPRNQISVYTRVYFYMNWILDTIKP